MTAVPYSRRSRKNRYLSKFIGVLKNIESLKAAGIFAIVGGVGSALSGAYTFYEKTMNEDMNRKESLDRLYFAQVQDTLRNINSDKPLDRVAAIYALKNIAIEREKYRGLAVEFLTSLLRHGQSENDYLISIGKPTVNFMPVSREVQIAIRTLNDLAPEIQNINLNGAPLMSADFSDTKAFRQKTSFVESKLLSANFSGSDVSGVNFSAAEFNDYVSYYALKGDYQEFSPCEWNEKNSKNQWKKWRFGVNFAYADARNAKFNGAGLSGAIFIGTKLTGTSFDDANVTSADFTNAEDVDLSKACADGPVYGYEKQIKRCGGEPRICNR